MAMIFDEQEAKEYGVDEAIMIQNLRFWINKNKANNKHFYEGKYWTYNSAEAFSKLFVFWSSKQIRRIIDSLVKKGIIIIGNFNKMKYDRTKWFAFNDENRWLKSAENSNCPNGQMDLPKRSNGFAQTGEPIPDINTDVNTDYLYGKKSVKKKEQLEEKFEEFFGEFWSIYPKKVAKAEARKSYKRALTKTTSAVILEGVKNYLKEIESSKKESKFIAHPTTWLNQERWDDYDQKNFSSSPISSAKPSGIKYEAEQSSVKYEVIDTASDVLTKQNITSDEFIEKLNKWKDEYREKTGKFILDTEIPKEVVIEILKSNKQ